jgi:hypothetical protein
MSRLRLLLLGGTLAALLLPTAARAEFGITPGSVSVVASNRDGTLDAQAGSHPYAYTVSFKLNSVGQLGEAFPDGGAARDVIIDLPPGFVGNPQAVPRCPRKDLAGITPSCPPATQVGVVAAELAGVQPASSPVYNLVPPPGVAAELGFNALRSNFPQNASPRADHEYGVEVSALNFSQPIISVSETIWGEPADPAHDLQRGVRNAGKEGEQGPVSTDAPRLPFLTLPTRCGSPLSISVTADSVLSPGNFVTPVNAIATDGGGNPLALQGCDGIPFSPAVAATPTAKAAEGASGLDFNLNLPNQGLLQPEAIAETEPETTEVTLPAGVTVNPSAAGGVVGCTEAQFQQATGEAGQGCPEASKLGTLRATSPLLEEPIEGAVYLAVPHANRFNSLLALYIIAAAPERGILVKQAGLVVADPNTGQLTTTFGSLPPLPYSSFELDLHEGPRAPLIAPRFCGDYTTNARLFSFANPGSPVERSIPFKVTNGARGGSCASDESQLPNKPSLEAGSTTPVAGNFSPFIFRVKREDGEQRFSSINATLPIGLIGKLKGVPYCPESGIATAGSRTAEGGGALENASPSCPAASQVGIVNVAAGAGSQPYVVQGKAYLAGPYKGAPLSLEIITPAIAGPFDLGSVAVRTALRVDPFTTQISAVSDPLPTILHGIELDVRAISLQMTRPEFTLNPTNCGAKSVLGAVTSLAGQIANLSNPFAVAGCKGLPFKPQLKVTLKGQTRRAGHPALRAELTYPKGSGYANLATAQVGLPPSEFLDQGNLNKVCKQGDLRAGTCPKTSIYGKAKAWTPLLDKPLEGPVYLGVGFGYKLPALVVELNGQIRVLAVGKVDTTKKKGLRNTFQAIPDAPFEKFVLELKGGKKYGLLENSTNICKGQHKAEVKFTGQNGAVDAFNLPVKATCKRGSKK